MVKTAQQRIERNAKIVEMRYMTQTPHLYSETFASYKMLASKFKLSYSTVRSVCLAAVGISTGRYDQPRADMR